ncbi:MAG: ATP-binding protein [Chloroflexi bacterium]|nr:ATP-binding protein [Chloroflexota bacterium]
MVVVPLAITLLVTLPLTVTGLNRLASVIAVDRLAEEVKLIDLQFQKFKGDLNDSADSVASNSILLEAVHDGDQPRIISSLLTNRTRLGVQYVQVVDINGVVIGQDRQYAGVFNESEIRDLQQLGLAEIDVIRMVYSPLGWLMTAVRPLKDSSGLLGSVAVGKLIDSEVLSQLNFNRSDILLIVFDDAGNVIASSQSDDDEIEPVSIAPDNKMVAMAQAGHVSLGTAMLGDNEQRAAYAPVALEGGSQGIFGVVLNTSPLVNLRDQLIAIHVIVTAALVLLVLGVGYIVTRSITHRILRLRDGAVEIGKGNLSVRIEETSNDEMGTLAHEFNRMTDGLNEKNSQLEQANRNLEMRVFERTEQLESANAELLQAQNQLIRTEQLAAIGELSAGVAHDLRNPLGAIRNGVYFLKARMTKANLLATEPRISESLGIMDDCVTQCDKIITDLLFFTRISAPAYSPMILKGVLDSTIGEIGTPEGLTVVKEFDDEGLEIEADYDQLVRVFSNLAINAQEAMPQGGVLTVGVKRIGTAVAITFTDTGTGLSPEDLEKVFNPLYTTKVQGTGLGLAVCQQIISKHKGKLEAYSQLGSGTTFTVTIPLKAGDTLTSA